MTDNEIIKALECCSKNKCLSCPAYTDKLCQSTLFDNVLDFINRQKAEIERLEKEKESIKYCYEQAREYNNQLAESCETNCKKFNMTTRAEAIKEFAERLRDEMRLEDDCRYDCMNCLYECKGHVPLIDALVKEMTEVQE